MTTTARAVPDDRPPIHTEMRRLPVAPANPLALLPGDGAAFAWADPEQGTLLVARGAAAAVEAVGVAGLAEAMEQATAAILPRGGDGVSPRWVGGFGFAGESAGVWTGYPGAWFFVPEVLLSVDTAGATLTAAAPDPAACGRLLDQAEKDLKGAGVAHVLGRSKSITDGPSVEDRAQRALEAIESGAVDKVVVSSHRTLELDSEVDLTAFLVALARREPTAFQYLLRPPSAAAWIGASPERLIAVHGNEIRSMALAGTAPRGPDETADVARAKALIGNPKEREEHSFVVHDLVARLETCSPEAPASPEIRRLARMFHLQSTVRGIRPQGAGVLDLAAMLHPTAALGGSPREAALDLIAQLEPEGRGWFGGAIGWLDASGEGELTVAIRGALVSGATVTGFAGAGVVAGSDPAAEAAEVALKLDNALGAFEAVPA